VFEKRATNKKTTRAGVASSRTTEVRSKNHPGFSIGARLKKLAQQ
jgi:hypothetical protein